MKKIVLNMMKKGLVFSAVIAGSSTALFAQGQGGAAKPPAVLVQVEQAGEMMMAPEVLMPGTIVSVNDSLIAAQIAGRVNWVAREGTQVSQGDVIARLDDRDFQFQVNSAKSQVTRLEARVAFLKTQLSRFQKLAATNNTTASRLDEAENNLLVTAQDLNQARIALMQAELALDRTTVRAPFPGRVVERLAQVGEYRGPGQQLVRLVDTTHLEATVQAPVKLSPYIRSGQNVSITVNDKQYEAKVRATIPVGDDISRTMEVRVDIPAGDWVVGSAIQVSVPSNQPEKVVAVNRDALILRVDGTYIFRIDEDNKAERLKVRTGGTSGSKVAILGGLSEGDQVIIRGGERLRPGQAVRLNMNAREANGR